MTGIIFTATDVWAFSFDETHIERLGMKHGKYCFLQQQSSLSLSTIHCCCDYRISSHFAAV